MAPKSPSLREKHLSFESLESRQMMSGTDLTPMQQQTVQAAHMVLRGDPVELLQGTREVNSATVECIADSPVFTDGSFTLEASVRPNAIRAQTLVSKYNSQSEPGQSFFLGMLADGRLQFCVYGNPAKHEMQMIETDGPLQAGAWQKVQASFDIQSQKMSLTVNGEAIAATQVEGLPPVTAIYDSQSPVRVGDVIFGGGRSWIYEGGMQDITYYPVQSFDAQEEAAAADAVIAEITEEETPAEPVAEEQQATAASIDAVLRAEPVTLLSGTREFNGSSAECIADSPVFTDGSFTVEVDVRPDTVRTQALISKYDSQNERGQSFYLGMDANGNLQFMVYGDPARNEMQMIETTGAPVKAGVWQNVRASFDITNQKMTVTVDGAAVAATQIEGLPPVTAIHNSQSPVRVGGVVFGSGFARGAVGGLGNGTYWPIASFGIPEAQESPASPAEQEEQQGTVAAIDGVLRAEPVELLSGTREFNGSSMECIADSPVFTDGSFVLETQIRVNAIQQQSIITKYDSGAEDRSFHFCMLNTGQLQFDVYGDAEGRSYLTFRTTGTPLAVGQWQTVRASFDLEHRRLSITVDGQDVPGETIQTGAEITALYDSKTAVRVGGRRTGGGDGNYLNAGIQDARFYPIDSFAEKTQATDTVNAGEAILPLTEAEVQETAGESAAATTPSETQGTEEPTTSLAPEQTTEQAALSLTERQVQQYQKRMAGANERLAACADALQSAQGDVQSLEQTIASASQTIAGADSVLEKAALEAQMEKNVGTSSFRIDGICPNRTIWLNYTDVPAGYDAVMFGSGFGEREAIAAGSGTVDFGIPQGLAADAKIGIMKHGTNEVVGTLVDFRILKGYVRENVDGSSIALPGLSAARTISAEAVDQSQKERSSAVEQLTKAQAALPQAQADAAQALLDWQAAQRETIAYGSITGIEPQVTELRSGEIRVGFRVHYRSPDADSRMEVCRDGVRLSLTDLSHPAGQPDGAFVYAPEDGSWHGDLEFRYFSRGENGMRQVSSATATYNTRELPQNAARVTSTFSALTSHDTGRLVDTPLPYDLKVMSVRGSSAVLHFTSPDDESVITSSTGGLYGQEVRSHPGGTTTGVALLTLTPNAPGQYSFSLQDRSGTVRDTVMVQWDGSALTVMDAQDQWSVEHASTARSASLSALGTDSAPAERVAQTLTEETTELLEQERLELLLGKQMNLSTNPIIDGVNRALWETQAQDLYERSCLFVSPEKMHEHFFTVHPDWRPENFQSTVMRMWQDGGCNGPSGDTRDWLNGVILDQLGRFDRDLHIFSAAAAEIMQKGVRACIAIRQGQNEGPLFRELEDLITARNYWEAVGRLKGIGVVLPTRHAVIAEASRIVAQRIDDLVFKDSEDIRLHDNYVARQRSGIWSAEIDGKVNVSSLTERRTVARGYTQQEVSESENRRLQRAARLYAEARGYNTDTRVQVTIVAEGQPNIQRERQIADGTTQITITTAEASQIADTVDGAIGAGNGDLQVVSRELVAMLGEPETTGTGVETANAAQINVENLIKERVAARLNERLQSMTMEERATARGLLRLQEDGKLDEYFASLFNGQSSEAVDAELDSTGGYNIYYLIDSEAVFGAGHAAMIMGSESEGWYFFSFGAGSNDQGAVKKYLTENGNMEVGFFSNLNAAMAATARYDHFLKWNVAGTSSIRSAFRQASSHLSTNYNLFTENCDDIASDIIRAAGIQFTDEWMPIHTYQNESSVADETGLWETNPL